MGSLSQKNYSSFICVDRFRKSSVIRRRKIDQFYSDRSRILYSSSFRRLQQKAQVFSLEPNSSVRTRLTHSLEVSDLGRTLANLVAYELEEREMIEKDDILSVVAIVENACLLHDIGNPPFGHFGEAAIKDWAEGINFDSISENIGLKMDDRSEALFDELISDFREFDGNPQGFRTITKLHTDHDKYSLNLTYSTLLCTLKYPRMAGEPTDWEKAGYFRTEQELVEDLYNKMEMKLGCRYPFVYIMETADDIAYCMSDIADGIEKRILTEEKFLSEFKMEWEKKFKGEDYPVEMPDKNNLKDFNQDISIPWSKAALKEAVKIYIKEVDNIINGQIKSLISGDSPMGKVLDTIKTVSKRILYTSFEAESIEITGYAVITGILDKYSRVLNMKHKDFEKILNQERIKGFEYEKRLFHLIGKRYVEAYKYEVDKIKKQANQNFELVEWWLRTHLIIDHISGMTDEYALETYQMFEGIKLMR